MENLFDLVHLKNVLSRMKFSREGLAARTCANAMAPEGPMAFPGRETDLIEEEKRSEFEGDE